MRIIVIGAQGQVGWELTRRALALGHNVLAWDQAELDITDAAAVDQALDASGAYRTGKDNGYTYMILKNVRWIRPQPGHSSRH